MQFGEDPSVYVPFFREPDKHQLQTSTARTSVVPSAGSQTKISAVAPDLTLPNS